jgi:CRISPR/Cas system-associated exonuclease Cas4 (RecB family)
MSAHHKYGPSTLAAYELCSHFEGREDDVVHPVTAQGTKLHEALEKRDLSTLTPEEQRLAQWCIDRIDEWTEGAPVVHKEVRLDIGHTGGAPTLTFGTVDHVALDPEEGVGVVGDYKFGYHGVDAADTNIQGQAYVLGAFEKWGLREITLVFLLARRYEVTSHTYTAEDIDRIRARIETIIERAEKKMGEPTPYPHNCLYCANKAGCSAWIKMGLVLHEKYTGEALKLDPNHLHTVHGSQTTPDPEQMEIGLLLAAGMVDWGEAYKHHIRTLALEQGVEVPGHEIVIRKGKSTVTGTAAEVFNAYAHEWVDEAEMLRVSKIDSTAFDSLLKSKMPRGQKTQRAALTQQALEAAGLVSTGKDIPILQKKKKATM